MKVHVSSMVGTSTTSEWDMNPQDTVGDLVQKVATSQAIEPSAMQLVRDGKALDPGQTLKQADIQEGETLKAVPQAREQGWR